MSFTVKMEGTDELVAALRELPKRATQKAVVQRTLVKAAEPTRDLASALAPDDPETPPLDLHTSVIVGKTISRQTIENAHPGDVTVYVGPDKSLVRHHGMEMEFGTFKDRPQPFMRPAWEATKDGAFDILGFLMWGEIDATAQRLARRAAKG